MAQTDILLDSGTNEVELMEFFLGTQSYAINVAKIQAVIPFEQDHLTTLPSAPPSMKGMLSYRDATLPLIDLGEELHLRQEEAAGRQVVLITEFNRITNGFLVDGVNRIHRLSWTDIEPLNPVLEKYTARLTGSFNVDGNDILVVDMEYIVAELFPDSSITKAAENQDSLRAVESRAEMRLIMAEDSTLIRKAILSTLEKAGFAQVTSFHDGQGAWDYMNKKDTPRPHILITDIEMPKMDGLTLCRKVKESPELKTTPVIVFSSLINQQMSVKCKGVGADAQISKPQIVELVDLIDSLVMTD